MRSSLKIAQRALPWLLIAPVLVPLVVWGGLMYPYLAPKTLLFYTLVLISLATFAFLACAGERFYFSRLKYWSAWIPALIVLLAYIASFFGIDFYRSFW